MDMADLIAGKSAKKILGRFRFLLSVESPIGHVQNEVLSGKLVLFGRFIIVRSGKKSYRGATLA